jgi:S1-C subfamily serine protease
MATVGVLGLVGGLALRPASSSAAGEIKEAPAAPSALDAIKTFSAGSQELYRKISASIVHVRPDVRVDQLVPDALKKDYDAFSNNAGPSATTAPSTAPSHRDRDRDHDGRGNRSTDSYGPGSRPRDFLNARRFMEQRLQENLKMDPDLMFRIRQGIARIDALRQGQGIDLIGVVIDSSGHVLVHAPLVKDADNKKLPVILPDGTETTATVRGTDFLRGLCVITLDSTGSAAPAPLATVPPAAGELLFSVATSRGNLSWTVASESSNGRRLRDSTFNIGNSDDRFSSYQFNCNGELASLSREGRATPVSAMAADLQAIVNDKPLPRHVIGVKYSLVSPDSPIRDDHPALALQPAVIVDEVTPGSPAAKAGLIKGDFIIKIDHKPISQLLRILAELRFGANDVDVDIIRGNDAKTLKLSLERPGT